MRLRFLATVGLMWCAACTEAKLPLAPTAVALPAPPLVPPPLPTSIPGVLSIVMPIDAGDLANTVFGLTPFGYHGGDHSADGHAGWDIEYRVGGIVRAAAAGTVDDVFPDPITGRLTVRIEHVVGEHYYRTIYANLATVNSGIAAKEVVRAGQSLGTPGSASSFGSVGTAGSPNTAAIHFQLDDLEFHREGPDPKAVTPEPFLSAEGKALFDRIWASAAYAHELVEPFATNPRTLSFPASRTWTRAGGDGPAGIRFTRSRSQVAEYEYALLAESGTVIETGAVALDITARPFPLIALTSPTAVRLGVYDIVSNELRLALANPGASRPGDLSAATVYRSSR